MQNTDAKILLSRTILSWIEGIHVTSAHGDPGPVSLAHFGGLGPVTSAHFFPLGPAC